MNNEVDDNTPVIIGVGQFSERPGDDGYSACSPMDLAGNALQAAINDTGADGVAAAIDTIAAIPQFEISTPNAEAPFGKSNNPPRSIGARVGAKPERAILEYVGGQAPQKLIGELASDIAQGRSSCAAIAGSEAISTVLTLIKKGDRPDWSEEVDGTMEARGFGMSGLIEKTALANGIIAPIPAYAIYDNARRAKMGLSLDQYRRRIGELFAPFTSVAAENPHAAAPVQRSAGELAEVTERNRIVAEPYTRMTVARDQVNQAAAIILASAGKARELGIAEERWVHIHASADAKEASVLEREDLAVSPASIAATQAALDTAGVGFDDIAHIDLYSCFAIAVTNIADAFGIAHDDPRGLTLTGGLPFFGGAGNNYSGHAIVEAVTALRADDEKAFAFVGANGGFMSKYSAGVYSRRPADWSQARWTKLPDAVPSVKVLDKYSGAATVESFTVMPGRKSTVTMIVARTPGGERVAATAARGDDATASAIHTREPVGRSVDITAHEEQRHHFTFAD